MEVSKWCSHIHTFLMLTHSFGSAFSQTQSKSRVTPVNLQPRRLLFFSHKPRLKKNVRVYCLNIKYARVMKPSSDLLKMAQTQLVFGENSVMWYRQMPSRSEGTKQILILVRQHKTFPSFRWKHAHSFATRGSGVSWSRSLWLARLCSKREAFIC